MAGWLSITVGFAAPAALAASAFGTYLANSVFDGDAGARLLGSAGVIVAMTAMHAVNLRVSAQFQVAATLLKIAVLGVLIVAGFATSSQPVTFLPKPSDAGLLLHPEFAVALFFVSYSYSGWNAAVYIVGARRPESFWGPPPIWRQNRPVAKSWTRARTSGRSGAFCLRC